MPSANHVQPFSHYLTFSAVEEDLHAKGIPFVEYGEVLEDRFGYPVCIQTVKWVIPDSQLAAASAVLLDHSVPISEPKPLLQSLHGEWETAGIMHRHYNIRVHLVPLSYTFLSLDDCSEALSGVTGKGKTLIPNSKPYLISLFRKVLSLPRKSRERATVFIRICWFLVYCVFPRLPDYEDEQDESEEHFQQRVEEALATIHQWEWRPEEAKYLDIAENTIRDTTYIKNLEE